MPGATSPRNSEARWTAVTFAFWHAQPRLRVEKAPGMAQTNYAGSFHGRAGGGESQSLSQPATEVVAAPSWLGLLAPGSVCRARPLCARRAVWRRPLTLYWPVRIRDGAGLVACHASG